MGSALAINNKKYAISVQVLAGEGDGTLIYRDANGKIHVVGPDPGPQLERITAAVKNIEAGVVEFQAATAGIKAAH
jgi:hypothetical protein